MNNFPNVITELKEEKKDDKESIERIKLHLAVQNMIRSYQVSR